MGLTKGWVNHPATLMWKGHTCFLAKYMNTMIDEWVARGYTNNMAKLPHCRNPGHRGGGDGTRFTSPIRLP